MKKSVEGFSLIEVIIAVAILAILSVPILVYFTDSAVQSAHGRDEQAADLAAQSVIEEIDSIDGFKNIEQHLGDTENWDVTSVADNSQGKTLLVRNNISVNPDLGIVSTPVTTVDEDGNEIEVDTSSDIYNYFATVEIDYGEYYSSVAADAESGEGGGETSDPADETPTGDTEETTSTLTAKYNKYDYPEIPEIYSSSSVVIEETDETEMGFNDLFYQINKSAINDDSNYNIDEDGNKTLKSDIIPMDEIKAKTKRSFVISVTKDATNSNYYNVTGGYKFKYTGDTVVSGGGADVSTNKESFILIKSAQVKVGNLKNIYFFYSPIGIGGQDEVASVDLSGLNGIAEADKPSITFIRQSVDGIDASAGKISLDTSSDSFGITNANYYTNDSLVVIDGASNSDRDNGPVKNSQAKRIALVTVRVYYTGDDPETSKVLATCTTTKVI